MLLHYLTKQKNTEIAFSLTCYITALLNFYQSLFDFFNVIDL